MQNDKNIIILVGLDKGDYDNINLSLMNYSDINGKTLLYESIEHTHNRVDSLSEINNITTELNITFQEQNKRASEEYNQFKLFDDEYLCKFEDSYDLDNDLMKNTDENLNIKEAEATSTFNII